MSTADHAAAVMATLKAARKQLSDSKHWCRGAMARDARGQMIAPDDSTARQWDAIGAIILHATSAKVEHVARASLFRTTGRPLNTWSDEVSHEDLLDAFDRTIERVHAHLLVGPIKTKPKRAPRAIQEAPSRPGDRSEPRRTVSAPKRLGGSL